MRSACHAVWNRVTAGTLIVLSTGLWLIGLLRLYDRLRPLAPRFVAVAVPLAVFATIGGLAFEGIGDGCDPSRM